MESLNLCPLEVEVVDLQKQDDSSGRNYAYIARYNCNGLCGSEADGARGIVKHDNILVDGSYGTDDARKSLISATELAVRYKHGCPFEDLEEITAEASRYENPNY